jgi:protoheme IX farnesyltransferase
MTLRAMGTETKPKEITTLRKITKQIKIYKDLSKFNLSALVVATAFAGYMCAGVAVNPVVLGATCVGTMLCSSSANTFNQWVEIERDAKMMRTRARPLPSRRCTPNQALSFGVLAGSAGVSTLYLFTNPVVAGIGAANIFLYAGPYTFSKPRTELNTWAGAVVGALPPLMGWAAASGGTVMVPDALALAGLLYLWQFPHFFALAWVHRADYARGLFQMVPVNDPTGERTAGLISRYSLYLTAFPPAVASLGLTSSMFAVEGTAANLYLLYLARRFSQDRSEKNARSVFFCSLWYLPVLLAAFVFHSRMWAQDKNDNSEQLLTQVRDQLRGVCAHEMLYNSSCGRGQGELEKDTETERELEGVGEGSTRLLCPRVLSAAVASAELELELELELAVPRHLVQSASASAPDSDSDTHSHTAAASPSDVSSGKPV